MFSENHGANKRDAILESAYMVFTEKGFHTAKVSEIANKARVGKGTVYEYFSSKEDLLRGVIEEGIKYYISELNRSTKGTTSPWQKIRNIMFKHAYLIKDSQKITQIMFNNFGIMTEEFHQFLFEQREVIVKTIQEIMEDGIKKGEIRPIRINVGVRLLMGSMMAINCDMGCLEDDEIEEYIATLERSFLV